MSTNGDDPMEGFAFVTFESFDDMAAFQAEQEAVANNRVLKIQRGIEYGSHVIRFMQNVVIFGRVLARDEAVKPMPDDWNDDWGDRAEAQAETEFETRILDDAYARGYRFGRWHSTWEPEGELGSAHISELYPILPPMFEEAQGVGWDTAKIDGDWLRIVAQLHITNLLHRGARPL